jgi:ABC-type transport system involved in cytochrome bd biosynthesis fused ATPase/permease subunit
MDDPISALDASVRKKIIMNLIMNHLKSKTRVLVTHAIDFIHLADKVILMEKGRIAAQGTYSELKENDQFQKLIEINKIN